MWGPQTLHWPTWDKWVSAGLTMPPLNILSLPPTEPTNPPLSDNFNFTMLSRFSDGHELVNHLHSLLLTWKHRQRESKVSWKQQENNDERNDVKGWLAVVVRQMKTCRDRVGEVGTRLAPSVGQEAFSLAGTALHSTLWSPQCSDGEVGVGGKEQIQQEELSILCFFLLLRIEFFHDVCATVS